MRATAITTDPRHYINALIPTLWHWYENNCLGIYTHQFLLYSIDKDGKSPLLLHLPYNSTLYNSQLSFINQVSKMSKKVLLGLAVVGGGLYYYDQNVLPIFTTDKKGAPIAVGNTKPSKDVRKEYGKLEDKAKDFGSQLKKTVDESVTDLKNKKESAVSSIKNSETYEKWSGKFEDYKDDVKVAADSLEKKPVGNKLAAKYIDLVNKLGETDDERLKELASATSERQQEIKKELAQSQRTWYSWLTGQKDEIKHDVKDKKDELAAKAEKEKNSWFNWGSEKADEAEKAAKDAKASVKAEKESWVNWGSAKADEAQQAAKNAEKDLKAEKDKWVNWGSAKSDEAQKAAKDAHQDAKDAYESLKKQVSDNFEAGKQRALDEYYRAKKNVEDLTKQAQERAGQVKSRVEDDEHLRRAKNDFQSALKNLKRFGNDLVDGK